MKIIIVKQPYKYTFIKVVNKISKMDYQNTQSK